MSQLPNPFQKLSSIDYNLFTRLCKHLAKHCCENAFSKNHKNIIESLNLKRFNKYLDLETKKKKVRLEFVNEFAMSEDDFNYYIQDILKII